MRQNHKDIRAAIREMNETVWGVDGKGWWLTQKDFLHDEERVRKEMTPDEAEGYRTDIMELIDNLMALWGMVSRTVSAELSYRANISDLDDWPTMEGLYRDKAEEIMADGPEGSDYDDDYDD